MFERSKQMTAGVLVAGALALTACVPQMPLVVSVAGQPVIEDAPAAGLSASADHYDPALAGEPDLSRSDPGNPAQLGRVDRRSVQAETSAAAAIVLPDDWQDWYDPQMLHEAPPPLRGETSGASRGGTGTHVSDGMLPALTP